MSPITQSSNGTTFDFTFASRTSQTTITQLGETLNHLLPTIPDGTIIFFPSYSYLSTITTSWQQKPTSSNNTDTASIWTRLAAQKPIFTESQSGNTSTEDVLVAYTSAIAATATTTHKGALLLAVIGGKLSEGINFSDALGRCVIVIGLPYPNPHSVEWKARMEYIEQKASHASKPTLNSSTGNSAGNTNTNTNSSSSGAITAGTASREFAENVCMRAVNQAIGRAVRHKGDWAAILLVDRRYAQKRIREKLPKWIQASLEGGEAGFGGVERGLRGFYGGKVGHG